MDIEWDGCDVGALILARSIDGVVEDVVVIIGREDEDGDEEMIDSEFLLVVSLKSSIRTRCARSGPN